MTSEAISRLAEPRGTRRQSAPASQRRVEAPPQGLALIFDLVRRGASNTRHELEQRTGLGRALVADRVATLLDLGLVEEGELGPATGGRAPRRIGFKQSAGSILVAFFDKSTLSVGIADLSGRLLVEHHEEADITAGPQATIARLETLFEWAREQHALDNDLWGIGVALPGPIEPAAELSVASPTFHFMPNWGAYPVVARLAARHLAPVWLRSSVEAMTLGEHRAGQATGEMDFVFVKLGRGISAGLVSNGRLHRGALGGAGMIGHVRATDDDDQVCVCGNTGCLDTIAGGDAIARAARQAAENGGSPHLAARLEENGAVGTTDVGFAAQQGDPFAADLLARCGRAIGRVLAGVANAFNPSLIVLSGDFGQAGTILLAAIRQEVYRQSHPLVTRDLRITQSQMGSSAGLVGSAQMVADEIFDRAFLETWIAAGSPLRTPKVQDLIEAAPMIVTSGGQAPQPPDDNIIVRRDRTGE